MSEQMFAGRAPTTAFMDVLQGRTPKRTPVWIMRQAGRYLPEYRELRSATRSFMQFIRSPRKTTEAALQPLRRYDLDATIVFSDILTIPEALGQPVRFVKGQGPVLDDTIRTPSDVANLPDIDVTHSLQYVGDAVRDLAQAVDGRMPVIGFAGSPWTLACYMIQGHGKTDFPAARAMAHVEPDIASALLSRLSEAVGQLLCLQADAGASVLQVFDSWGGLLDPQLYHTMSAQPLAQAIAIVRQHHPDIPVIAYVRGSGAHLPTALSDIGASAIGLDWTHDFSRVRKTLARPLPLQGNLDPAILTYADEAAVKQAVYANMTQDSGPKRIFNLGHGITPNADPNLLKCVIDTVHSMPIL